MTKTSEQSVVASQRPEFVTEEHLEFLDDLRESGKTNMFGARPYLVRRFRKLTSDEAGKVLSYWMHTFSERHSHDKD